MKSMRRGGIIDHNFIRRQQPASGHRGDAPVGAETQRELTAKLVIAVGARPPAHESRGCASDGSRAGDRALRWNVSSVRWTMKNRRRPAFRTTVARGPEVVAAGRRATSGSTTSGSTTALAKAAGDANHRNNRRNHLDRPTWKDQRQLLVRHRLVLRGQRITGIVEARALPQIRLVRVTWRDKHEAAGRGEVLRVRVPVASCSRRHAKT